MAGARAARFYSFDSLADNFTHCFAAPVYQDNEVCVATLCLIAPREDAVRNYERYQATLAASAREFSDKLGTVPLTLAKRQHGLNGD